ncbi:MAG: threonine synthase [Bacteroidia bacterium]|nr:threonine synthase [Bacteroidia bacterium]
MKFYSTNDTSLRVNLKEAVINSLPKDRGLYMPEEIKLLGEGFWQDFENMSFQEIAFEVSQKLIAEAVPPEELRDIVEQAVNFDAPVHNLDKHLHILELFHGPTLAFKDFGARFMAKLMAFLTQSDEEPLTILVATSGDTGGAVASGFYKAPGIQVMILYPSGRVSPLQEKQLTTLGANIKAFEIEGAFDDCQAMVKQAFLDEDLNHRFRLTSANSINIARLIPQSFYYFRAYQQLIKKKGKLVFCVPSGNFGNLTAGLIAQKMGLPIKKFIAATNKNDVVPRYLESGQFQPRESVATVSNAMDVGNPSNFVRMGDLFGNDWVNMKNQLKAYAFDDEQTLRTIDEVKQKFGYTIDPHGAVAYLAAKKYLLENPDDEVVILGTAHPAKFPEAVKKASGTSPQIPARLAQLTDLKKESILLPADYQAFKDKLMSL